MRAPLIALGVLLVVNACRSDELATEGHLLVYVDTDAPLPRAGRRASPLEPMPLVDTVRIELLTTEGDPACASCSREFSLDEEDVNAGATFTVLAREARKAVLHATAFRAVTVRSGLPGARIEVWSRVPAPPREGARPMTLRLPMDAFGRPLGSLAAPVDLLEGPPARPRIVWRRAERRPCTGEPPPGAVCVPGGAFWMGGPDDPAFASFLSPRVVTLSPFFVDRTEVTVRAYRETSGDDPRATPWSGSLAGTRQEDFCTFTREPGRFEDHPVNCIDWADARAHCIRRGGDLLSEAQREYVASALNGLPYVWGFDPPGCADAVLALGPQTERFSRTIAGFDTGCRRRVPPFDPELDAIGFSRPVGVPHGRDVLELPGGAVHDLAGNMVEWVRDDWQPRSGPCWTSPEIAHDPVCSSDPTAGRTLRGASWISPLATADAWLRQEFPAHPGITGIGIGIRCVYPSR